MSIAVAPAVVVERSVPMAGAVELVLYHPPSAVAVNPGQFFQLAVSAPHTILRRPYSAAWSDPASGRIGFIFNVVGAGSAWLSVRHEGHEIDLLGPLGRGFALDGDGPAVCIAGGLGVAVFPGVVQALVARGREVTMLEGARTAAQLLPAERFPGAATRGPEMRSTGEVTGGPRPFSRQDRSAFLSALDQTIRRLQRAKLRG